MKRERLIRYLEKHGAQFVREGSRHTVYEYKGALTEIPRHTEIHWILARKICKDLDLPPLQEK